MRYGLRIAVRSLAHLLVIIIFTCSTSYGSSPEVSKSAPDNKANKLVDKKSGFEMGNNSCVISACLGKIKDKCEMNIETMINSGPSVKSDIDENYFKEIRKVIKITLLNDWPLSSTATKSCLGKDDVLSYKIYKNNEHEISHVPGLLRVPQKVKLEQHVGECDFTYDELFQMAEGLVWQDSAQLGKDAIMVKHRLFKQSPLEDFIESPIIKKPY